MNAKTTIGLVIAALLLAPACAMEVSTLEQEEGMEPDDAAAVASEAVALTATTFVRRRFIPLRFVQFKSAAGLVVPDAMLNEKILHANTVFAKAGIQVYLRANHIVSGSPFRTLETCDAAGNNCTDDLYTWPSNESTSSAIAPFRSDCQFDHPVTETELTALERAASNCAPDGEILVYVSDSRSTGGQYPWESRIIGISRYHMDIAATEGDFGVFAHELGHYLGLSHTFPGGFYGLTNESVTSSDVNPTLYNPETGQPAKLWDFWDLVYKPSSEAPVSSAHRFFTSEQDARLAATSSVGFFQPIESYERDGYLCRANDSLCLRPDGTSRPAQTLRMVVGYPNSSDRQEAHFTGSPGIKAFSFAGGSGFGVNIMSYGYPGEPTNHWAAGLSGSQVTQILRSLRYDIQSQFGPEVGLFGHRPLLGDIWVRSWEGYVMQVGIDLPGNSYSDFALGEPIAALCRNACLQESACKAYTYVGPRNGNQARCRLKTSASTPTLCTDCISGDAQGLQPNINLNGSDYRSIAGLGSPELCEAACGKETRCRAYTWVRPGVQGPSSQCWLKEAQPARTSDTNTTSGLRHNLRNINVWGGDYRNFVPSPANEQTCQTTCTREDPCVAYTFVPAGLIEPSARCWLKSLVGELRAGSGMASGVKGGLDFNTFLLGTVSSRISSFTLGARGCQAECARTTQCVGWNLTPSSLGGRECQKLSSVTGSNAGIGTTSGLMGMEFF